jgi:hypothetical protein
MLMGLPPSFLGAAGVCILIGGRRRRSARRAMGTERWGRGILFSRVNARGKMWVWVWGLGGGNGEVAAAIGITPKVKA